MIQAGLLLGFVPWTWALHKTFVVGLGVLLSLAFGFLVEVPVGGGLLAAANLLVGLLVGLALQWVLRRLTVGRRQPAGT